MSIKKLIDEILKLNRSLHLLILGTDRYRARKSNFKFIIVLIKVRVKRIL